MTGGPAAQVGPTAASQPSADELVRVRDEMEEQTRQLLRARSELAALARRYDHMSQFLALLGHELRNPLAPILSSVEILERAQDTPALVEHSGRVIKHQVQHIVRLVDDLLDVTRIRSGGLAIRRERISFSVIVDRALEIAQPLVAARCQVLTARLLPHPVFLSVDSVRMIQAIANLLLNATKYTPPNGQIELRASIEEGELQVTVRDTGVGIRSDVLPHLFEMFERGDQRSASPGLGLGLSLTRHIIELHGGRIQARSEGAGRGSEFLVWLPVPPQRSRPRRRPQVPARPQQAAGGSGRRVLIVDDQHDVAESLAILLGLLGHEARFVVDGAKAVETALTFAPELMLLDIGMPGVDGYEVARRIRQHPELRGVRVVALSGWCRQDDRKRAREAGFDGYLLKPVNQQELEKLIGR